MNPQRIYVKDAQGEFKETEIYFCDKCKIVANHIYSDSYKIAEKCCNYKCEVCGEPLRNFMTLCVDCQHKEREVREQKRWDEVKKIKLTFPNLEHFYNEDRDKFYQDYDEMIEDIFDDFCEWRDTHPIKYCSDDKYIQPRIYLTKDCVFTDLDISDVLTNTYEEYIYEDCDVEDLFDVNSIDILYDAVEQFNKLNKDHGLSWLPNYSIGVDLIDNMEDFETEFNNED